MMSSTSIRSISAIGLVLLASEIHNVASAPVNARALQAETCVAAEPARVASTNNGKTYSLYVGEFSPKQAKEFCASCDGGGTLATPVTQDEQDTAALVLKESDDGVVKNNTLYWLGFRLWSTQIEQFPVVENITDFNDKTKCPLYYPDGNALSEADFEKVQSYQQNQFFTPVPTGTSDGTFTEECTGFETCMAIRKNGNRFPNGAHNNVRCCNLRNAGSNDEPDLKSIVDGVLCEQSESTGGGGGDE
jgi:hypothetical protein